MTIQELCKKYYFHDSMITKISYSKDIKELEFMLEFCNWAQNDYKENDPELLKMKLTFESILDYDGITGDIDYFSVLDCDIVDDRFHMLIEDDFHQEVYEFYLNPSNVKVEIVGAVV